jgi:SAM-dependent methyltransferase
MAAAKLDVAVFATARCSAHRSAEALPVADRCQLRVNYFAWRDCDFDSVPAWPTILNRSEFTCLDLAKPDAGQLETFDRAFAFGVLHHLSDELAEPLVELVRQVLRPGGRFASIDPCYVTGQSRIAKWVIDNDRGLYVRDVTAYKTILSKLGEIEIRVHHDLYRIPFTQIVCRFDRPLSH